MLYHFLGEWGSQISMLKDIMRQGLGKSELKFQHGRGGIKNGPKNPDVFYVQPLCVEPRCLSPQRMILEDYKNTWDTWDPIGTVVASYIPLLTPSMILEPL